MAESKLFYVWVTMISEPNAERLVGKLVRRNWKVQALGNHLVLHSQESPCALVAISLSRTEPLKKGEEVGYTAVLEEVKDVLKRLDVKYMNLIVTESTGCTWCLGNINLTQEKKQLEEEKKGLN
jgi:hypothetical protein